MIDWAKMLYHLVLILKLWMCLENKSWGSLHSLLTLTDNFETLITLSWELAFPPLHISVPTLPRAISKHSTWKPLGAMRLPGTGSARFERSHTAFWRCFYTKFSTTLLQNDILGSCVASKLICHQKMAVWCRDSHCLQNRACCSPGCIQGCSLAVSGVSVLLVGTAQGMLKLERGVWLLL